MKDIYVLGIESSCDETAASIVKNGREIYILYMEVLCQKLHQEITY